MNTDRKEQTLNLAAQQAERINYFPTILELARIFHRQEEENQKDYLERIIQEITNKYPRIENGIINIFKDKDFFKKNNEINEQEIEAFLFVLFSLTKPSEQKDFLENNKKILFSNKEEYEKIKQNFFYSFNISFLLENIDARGKLSFLGSVSLKERKEYQETINALFENENIDTSDKLSFLGASLQKKEKNIKK
ncbi:MAG: hypothetical protein AAB732_02305 [Patescibacteria group bacterium]